MNVGEEKLIEEVSLDKGPTLSKFE